ncbi:MAG: PDC sensor domain-containing protein [Rhodoferax sp.]
MPMTKLPTRWTLLMAEWLSLLAVLLALGGFIAYSEYLNYQQTDAREHARLASQARVIEKNLASQLLAADRALQGLQVELARRPSKSAGASPMNERLKLISDTLPGISTILITNASGKIIHSNVASLLGFDTSGRDYFQQALKQRRQNTLFVSAPFTSALGKTSISLVRELTSAQGGFGGVLLAALDPDFLVCCWTRFVLPRIPTPHWFTVTANSLWPHPPARCRPQRTWRCPAVSLPST